MTTLDPRSRAATRGWSDLTIRNLFIIPTLAFLIIFNVFPLIYSLGFSFTDFKASSKAPAKRAKDNPNFFVTLAATAGGKFLPQTGAALIRNDQGVVIGAAGGSGGQAASGSSGVAAQVKQVDGAIGSTSATLTGRSPRDLPPRSRSSATRR